MRALADDPRSRRTPSRNPGRPPMAIEVEVPEPGDRAEDRAICRATRLDPVEVAVVAERLHGVANGRIDSAVGPLGHRVGDVESLEEKR